MDWLLCPAISNGNIVKVQQEKDNDTSYIQMKQTQLSAFDIGS